MIDMSDVVEDGDMAAPEPFTVLRSTGTFVAGGFQSTTTALQAVGPVQRATPKDISMLPEADIVNGVMAFWWNRQIFVTRGKVPLPSTQGTVPVGAVPGSVYTLATSPAADVTGTLTKNGLLLIPNVDYTLAGNTITLASSTALGDALYFSWPVTASVGQAASDILVYDNSQYRVLSVKHYPGSGYWKALGTRMSAI